MGSVVMESAVVKGSTVDIESAVVKDQLWIKV